MPEEESGSEVIVWVINASGNEAQNEKSDHVALQILKH